MKVMSQRKRFNILLHSRKVARSFRRSGIQCRDRFESCNDSERLDYEVAQGDDVEFLSVTGESCVAMDICSESWYEG